MSDVSLVVNDRKFTGWKNITINRTVESLAGSFSLEVNDRWVGQAESWPIYEEDACRVLIDEETVIAGYVDRRMPSFGPKSRSLALSGRDAAAALVDCSAMLDKWTFRNATIIDIARKVAEPFGVDVFAQPGLELLKAPAKLVVSPGDSAFDVINAAAAAAGVMVVSTGDGAILITRAGTNRATTALIEGENLIAGSATYDASNRFRNYHVATQTPGSDNSNGNATRVRGVATDPAVSRSERSLIVRPGGTLTKDYAKQRAAWEAMIRAARADAISVTVHKWHQNDGTLWPLNALVPVSAPTLGIEGTMRIASATHTASGSDGETTELALVRPDAFAPDPSAIVQPNKSKQARR